MNDIAYHRSIEKNLTSITHALWAWKELEAYDKYRKDKRIYTLGISFLEITTKSLFCDMLRNSILVLDKHRDAASFWSILKKGDIDLLESYSKSKTESLKSMAVSLNHIRDKDFFHHDKSGILDTKKVWQEAGIVGKDLGECIQYLFTVLRELYVKVLEKEFHFYPDEHIGEDFIKILELAAKNHIIEVYPKK